MLAQALNRGVAASLLGLSLWAAAGATARPSSAPVRRAARAAHPLEAGALLVARRGLPDPNFAETVVLLLAQGQGGAIGLVVNRPSDVELSALSPRVDGLEGRADHLYIGGPVPAEELFVLVRADGPPAGAEAVFDGVYMSHSAEVLERLGREAVPAERLRVYAGYAGWAPGQLEHEVDRGDWYIAAADEESIFTSRPRETWHRLIPPVPTERADAGWPAVVFSPQRKWGHS